LKTIKFYSVIKHYFCALKYSVPGLSSHLSLLTVLLKRMIVGAGAGFKRFLRVRGVGYKFELQQTLLKVNVGFTHVLTKNVPSEFVVKFSRKFKVIRFRSKSLNMLTGILSALHALRKPDAYKGKGIRYKGEITHLKPGKDRKKGLSKKKKI
jgi:large subunit ribosomal protein L6